MRTWRRFYRRHRIAATAAALGVAALVLVCRVPLMPDSDALFTPVSVVSTLVASPVAGGALLVRQRSRKAIRWYALAMLAGATAPMLYGYFHNILRDTPMPSTVGDVVVMLSSFAPALLFVGGALLGYWLARRRW